MKHHGRICHPYCCQLKCRLQHTSDPTHLQSRLFISKKLEEFWWKKFSVLLGRIHICFNWVHFACIHKSGAMHLILQTTWKNLNYWNKISFFRMIQHILLRHTSINAFGSGGMETNWHYLKLCTGGKAFKYVCIWLDGDGLSSCAAWYFCNVDKRDL